MFKWLPDIWFTVCYLLAGIFSLVVLSSISPEHLPQQAIAFGLGLAIYTYLANQDSAVYKTFAPFGYLFALLLLLATFVLGTSVRGAVRWIPIGTFQLQAGEFAKPFLILVFAYVIERFPPRTLKNIGINALLFALPVFLIFRQPDLGTALVVSAIWLSQIFVAGLPFWLIGGGGALAVIFGQSLPHFLHDYQLKRLETFVDPFRDPLGAGYNVIQSIIAVGSGGISGLGLGHGTQSHLSFLPERHTDFIFASLAEELGLVGAGTVLVILGAILYRLLSLATHTRDSIARTIYVGIFSYLACQTFINVGMNIGIAPVTGVTLPLISYGGSSIIATALALGVAASLVRSGRTRTLLEIR